VTDRATPSDAEALAAHLEATNERIAELLEEAAHTSDMSVARAQDLFADFASNMEELRVAEEELVVQSEQLTASTLQIDAERERYAALFEFAPDGYVQTDEMGKIREANSSAVQLLGVSARALTGKLIQSFFEPSHRRSIRRLLSELSEGIPVDEARAELVPRDGAPRWVDVRVARRYEPAEDSTGILWLIRDVTDRVKLEQEVDDLRTSVDVLSALASINRLVAEDDDGLQTALQRLVDLGSRTARSDAAAMLLGPQGPRALVFTTDCAGELSTLQASAGGPSAETLIDGQPRAVGSDDLARWPALEAGARRYGVRSIVTHPIRVDGAIAGTFTLYTKADAGDAATVARLLADHATVALANAELYTSARQLATHLAAALESRGVIEQAKGILMATQGCGPDEAFDILRRASQRQNRKLRLIAENIVSRSGRKGAP
jgi:PAS domain S-box-containing protein